MKILLVTDYGWPAGGAEQMVRRLRDGFRALGHDARVFATDIEPEPGLNFADYRCFGTLSPLRTLVQTANPLAARALRKVLDEFRPDIVHVRMFLTQLSPLVLAQLRGQRALYHLAWYRAICPTGRKALPDHRPCTQPWGRACLQNSCVPLRDWPLHMVQLAAARRGLSVFQRIVANSGHVRGIMAQAGIASEVIHNGVPVVAPAAAEQDSAPTVLFAGRLTAEKGCQTLVEAMAQVRSQLPGARLLVAGQGPLRPALEAQATALGGGVRFLGQLDQPALAAATRAAWLQCVPSLWDEPFGIAALDGMAQARAVIASAAGGLAEIVVDGETGLQVPPGDAAALAAALLALLSDPAAADRMGSAGRQRLASHFSMDRCTERFLALYKDMLAEPANC